MPSLATMDVFLKMVLLGACGGTASQGDPGLDKGDSSVADGTSRADGTAVDDGPDTTDGGLAPCPKVQGQSFAVDLMTFDGKTDKCDYTLGGSDYGPDGTLLTIEGTVVASASAASSEMWTIDSCAPNSGCTATLSTLKVQGEGLVVGIAQGTFVNVELRRAIWGGPAGMGQRCGVDLRVRNLATWGGATNPRSNDEKVWLLGSSNGLGKFDDLTMGSIRQTCDAFPGTAVFAMTLHWNDAPASEVFVPPSATVDWMVAAGSMAGNLRVRNDYNALPLEGSPNRSFWIARLQTP